MRQGPKPTKAKVEAEPTVPRQSPKTQASRRRELEKCLAESLEQQTATSEILRVISSSPTDVQPVFDTIVRNAVVLCDALFGAVFRFDGDLIHLVAHHNFTPEVLELLNNLYPMRPSREQATGRVILSGALVHVHDTLTDPEYRQEVATRGGWRSILAVPMSREGTAIGVIWVARASAGPFPDNQIALLQTFADQAVIAIENVRLFKELEARNRALTESLEQQTATSEVLKVISRSTFDLQPVLETLIENAARLCSAESGVIYRFDGELQRLAAAHNISPAFREFVERNPLGPGSETAAGRAVLEGRTVHIHDVLADPSYLYPGQELGGYRTIVGVPMLREGVPIGVFSVWRNRVQPFTDKQIELVTTFADQGAIAIENVRLFQELEARNRELRGALQQQTATSEVLKVIGRSTFDLQPVFETLAENAVRLCEAERAFIFRFDGQVLRGVASYNASPELRTFIERNPIAPGRGSGTARAALERRTIHIHDIAADPGHTYPVRQVDPVRTLLAIPMLRPDELLGVIVIYRHEVRPFTDNQIALMETFADQAAIAIENVRLFNETKEALERQTATSEILRVIASSPTDLQPVFDTIVRSAVRLLGGFSATLRQLNGDRLDLVAFSTTSEAGDEALRGLSQLSLAEDPLFAEVVRDRVPCYASDSETDPRVGARRREVARARGYRSMLIVPMLGGDTVIGAITVTRREPGAFTDDETDLLRTFADQAVIAIENVRLFTELQAKNADLTEALEQQTATADILRVISSSPTDAQPVFHTIAERAVKLCEAELGVVSTIDGEHLHLAAMFGLTGERAEATRRAFPMPLDAESTSARAVRSRAVAHFVDAIADPHYQYKHTARAGQWRGTLAVPMFRRDQVIGAIFVARAKPGPFSDKQITLLQTFADQAVIAIENVRLFQELEARNRDLTEALEQQTATAVILRAMSGSPSDLQPVLNAVAENAARLLEADNAQILRVEEEKYLRPVASFGQMRAFAQGERRAISRGFVTGRAVIDRQTIHLHDLLALVDSEFPEAKDLQRRGGHRTTLVTPLLREGAPIGAIVILRGEVRPFSDKQIELLQTFADQAVIAIENVRLFKELEARNRDLTVSLEQQTATAEVLRVIAGTQTDAQPVFDTIAANALRLCAASNCAVFRFDGKMISLATLQNVNPEGAEAARAAYPAPPSRGNAAARAILTGEVVYIPDVRDDPEYQLQGMAAAVGFRSVLVAPMRREGSPIGAISVTAPHAGAFSDNQMELLKTFADQAVIAIENVRLFRELETRTRDLTHSVGELRALGEVSQAISSTLDLEAVLETIVTRAVELSGATSGLVYEFDEATQTFRARASHRITPEQLEALRAAPIRLGEGAVGRAGVIREPVQVEDIEDERQVVASQLRRLVAREGERSLLAVPLVREGHLLGGLVILRRERGAFSPEAVSTLQTLAAQSALAIHNARLFREIQSQKQYSETLVQTSPVAIATADVDGTVTGWNPGAERLFGYTQVEALGRRMEDLITTPDGREEVQANVRRLLEGDRVRSIARRARKDGTLVDVEISSVPVVLGGATVGMIAIYHDITELLEARRAAEAATYAKSAFLATMSHEIRTPMNAVIGMSGLLLNTPLNDEQQEYAEVIRQSGDALLTVINDILDFSKIEAGKLELESQPFDLRECIEGAFDLVAGRAAEKGLDLAYLIADGTPAAIVGDVTRLRQILLNLLSNAVKFTERGEVVLSVSARRLDRPAPLHELTFAVRDTGIGIAPDRLSRLFQSFSQVDDSTTRRYGGTGLGLAISQRLTDLMGGRIDVTSEVGRGSEFRFTIRAAPAEAPVSTRRDLGVVQPSLRGKRVLAVDDNATNRRILTAQLEAWGMVPRATGSPLEALGWIQAGERFDLGILDMLMPEMDGVTLAGAIRETPAGTALPLLLFTSLGRREAHAESHRFAAYLHKPIKPSQLFDTLASVLADQPVRVSARGVAHSEMDPDMARRHPLRILLAEDNVVNQKVALRLLGHMGYRADVAGNGLEAVAAVARQTYDMILMDVQMPEMDGFEATREINRRWPEGQRPRIVAMTANAMQGDRELCVAAGMDDYVSKPIRVEELVGALERCSRRSDAAPRSAPTAQIGTTAPPSVSGPASIDPAAIERLMATMGGTFIAELIDTFGEDTRELIATLRRTLAGADLEAFRRAAHSLKSTSETLGATGLAGMAKELEGMARAGTIDGAGDRVERLAAEYGVVAQLLGEVRRGLPA